MSFSTRSFSWLTSAFLLGTSLAHAQSIPFTKEQFTIDKEGLKLAQRELSLGDHELDAMIWGLLDMPPGATRAESAMQMPIIGMA